MDWGEAWRLTEHLATDPSSHVAAALNGWAFAVDRVDLVVRDLYDLTHQWAMARSKKNPKPYPRPWTREKRRTKPSADLTQAEIIAALRNAGHTMALPGHPDEPQDEAVPNG